MNMYTQSHQKQGFMALISILLLSTLTLSIVLSTTAYTTQQSSMTMSSIKHARARSITEGCIERALLSLLDNPSYTGNELLSIGSYSCTIENTTTTTSGQPIITAHSSIDGYTYRVSVRIETVSPHMGGLVYMEINET